MRLSFAASFSKGGAAGGCRGGEENIQAGSVGPSCRYGQSSWARRHVGGRKALGESGATTGLRCSCRKALWLGQRGARRAIQPAGSVSGAVRTDTRIAGFLARSKGIAEPVTR